MTTDDQLKEVLLPILEAAQAVDARVKTLCVNIGIGDTKPPFIKLYGDGGVSLGGTYGVLENLATVKPFDPLAENLAKIEKLNFEIAEIQSRIAASEANQIK